MDTLKLQDKSLWVKRPEVLKIVDIVKNRIQSGELKAGDKIRPEQYLSVEFNVSRTMIKKALMILINEGYVYLIPSKGYYVCEKEFYPYTLCFDEIFGEGGQFEEVRVISMNIIKPDFDVCRQLLISAKQNVIEIKRVYLSEKRIIVYEEKYIPYLRGVPIIEANLKDMVFWGNVSSKKPKTASTKTLNIIAKLAKGKIRQLLDTMEDEPILAVEQKQFDEHDKPIEWRVLYFADSGKKGLRAVTSAI